ncbi:hypothetical protein [Paenibacillus sp. MY03]|uniref:hypothetical protein n=1 Tax=Paenibacillus sp. MY03 TaxID=302980 RepID=UPI0015C69049|nr:hypothetical protein [Paenibacillus sp. MY03]
MLWGAVVGLGFLIAMFLGAKGMGEKFQLGCLIGIVVIVILAILFVALLTSM